MPSFLDVLWDSLVHTSSPSNCLVWPTWDIPPNFIIFVISWIIQTPKWETHYVDWPFIKWYKIPSPYSKTIFAKVETSRWLTKYFPLEKWRLRDALHPPRRKNSACAVSLLLNMAVLTTGTRAAISTVQQGKSSVNPIGGQICHFFYAEEKRAKHCASPHARWTRTVPGQPVSTSMHFPMG